MGKEKEIDSKIVKKGGRERRKEEESGKESKLGKREEEGGRIWNRLEESRGDWNKSIREWKKEENWIEEQIRYEYINSLFDV
jgi:hypothetical protein